MTTSFVNPAGDPQVGNLATPLNSSGFTRAFINNLPAYREGLSPIRRGLEGRGRRWGFCRLLVSDLRVIPGNSPSPPKLAFSFGSMGFLCSSQQHCSQF